MVPQEPLEAPEMLVPLVVPAKLAALVLLETLAKLVHLAAANTAHQLVWLQVIKRLRFPSHAKRSTRRLLGRFVDKIVPDNSFYHTASLLFDPSGFL